MIILIEIKCIINKFMANTVSYFHQILFLKFIRDKFKEVQSLMKLINNNLIKNVNKHFNKIFMIISFKIY